MTHSARIQEVAGGFRVKTVVFLEISGALLGFHRCSWKFQGLFMSIPGDFRGVLKGFKGFQGSSRGFEGVSVLFHGVLGASSRVFPGGQGIPGS